MDFNKRTVVNSYTIIDNWNRENYPYKKLEYGKWELTIPPNSDGTPVIKHLSEIKVV